MRRMLRRVRNSVYLVTLDGAERRAHGDVPRAGGYGVANARRESVARPVRRSSATRRLRVLER